jgi:hypothetical protein
MKRGWPKRGPPKLSKGRAKMATCLECVADHVNYMRKFL